MPKEHDEHGSFVPSEYDLAEETVIHDRARNRQIMRLRGRVVLPVGAEIELTDPNVTATVIDVRLLAGGPTWPARVCLDVKVPAEWWGESPQAIQRVTPPRSRRVRRG